MSVRVLRPGMLTTVQDLGRPGHQHQGIPVGGAMDAYAARLANLLVGNDEGAAVLEMTLAGPTLVFDSAGMLALAGASFEARLDGAPVAPWRVVSAGDGAVLDTGAARAGCRGYLAIAGGFDVPLVIDSRSTYLPAGFGGMEGRAVRTGDVIASGTTTRSRIVAGRTLAPSMRPDYRRVIRFIRDERAGSPLHTAIGSREFRVSARSDRMGYRLEGATMEWPEAGEVLSAAVAMGTIQLPPDGEPIVLMADCQTTGGYPVLGQVATVDLGSVAQLRPGDRVSFTEVSLEEAQRLYLDRERAIDALRMALNHPL